MVDSGDVTETLATATSTISATYRHPYQMHGSVGTSCAVADVSTDAATVWSATQAVHPLKSSLAMLLGLSSDGVRVIFRRGSGCYGINGADTAAYDAALMSQAVGRPVRVQLSRRDEMAWENYGHAYVIDQQVGVGASGRIVAWDYEAWFARRGGRPGRGTPGNVVTGVLAGFAPTIDADSTKPVPAPERSIQKPQQRRAVVCHRLHQRNMRRHRHGAKRAGVDPYCRVALFHRSTPVAVAAAKHLRP